VIRHPHPLLGAILGALWLAASPARAAEIATSVQAAFTYRGGDDEAYDLNRMNRGDNPWAPFHVLILAEARIDDHTRFFIELPIDPAANPSLWMTYVRPFVRLNDLAGKPWLNLQAGKLPTVFGAWGERTASTENGLIGLPLLFYYHTAIRAEIVPTGPDHFFTSGVRGRGYDFYSLNGVSSFVGSPLVYDDCWDTGVEVFGARGPLEVSLAGTNGTVSRPAFRAENYNNGHSFIGRIGYRAASGPLFGLRIGVSGAFGPYLNKNVEDDPNFPAGASAEDYLNTALGVDVAYARGPWQCFGELGRIGYEVPNIDPTLTAVSGYLELSRDFGPSWSAAVRQDAIFFSDLTSTTGARQGWDYDLYRWEAGINYRFRPGTRVRLGYQITRSPDSSELDAEMVALQLQVWTR